MIINIFSMIHYVYTNSNLTVHGIEILYVHVCIPDCYCYINDMYYTRRTNMFLFCYFMLFSSVYIHFCQIQFLHVMDPYVDAILISPHPCSSHHYILCSFEYRSNCVSVPVKKVLTLLLMIKTHVDGIT